MPHRLRKQWTEFKRSKPGERFADRYERNRRSRADQSWAMSALMWTAGFGLLLVGLFFCVFPGPGIPFLFAGGALVASRSRVAARFLDWCELKLRVIMRWLHRLWLRLPAFAKAAVVCAGAMISGASAYVSYRMLFGGS